MEMESILRSIKQMLGPSGSYDAFDPDIIMYINSTFMILRQAGVGPEEGFYIEDETAIWEDFSEDPKIIHGVKTYMYAQVRKIFDPPSSSTHMQALNEVINEFKWRLNVEAES